MPLLAHANEFKWFMIFHVPILFTLAAVPVCRLLQVTLPPCILPAFPVIFFWLAVHSLKMDVAAASGMGHRATPRPAVHSEAKPVPWCLARRAILVARAPVLPP